MVELRTPNPAAGGSSPSWPAIFPGFLCKERLGMFKKFMEFVQEVKLELKKVVFPTRKEVIGSTWVVIFTVLICAVFLGMVDMVLGKIMTSIFFNK
jgi:preprotein translocase subunit SecE